MLDGWDIIKFAAEFQAFPLAAFALARRCPGLTSDMVLLGGQRSRQRRVQGALRFGFRVLLCASDRHALALFAPHKCPPTQSERPTKWRARANRRLQSVLQETMHASAFPPGIPIRVSELI
eukprot:544816-Rhodomonas_salina.2